MSLGHYAFDRSMGFLGSGMAYFLEEGVVLLPDVSFTLGQFPPFPERFEAAPELAVELLARPDNIYPSISAYEMKYKIRRLFEHGTRLFWLVDPEEQDVTVYQQSEDGVLVSYRLTIDDTLTGGDVLPDFRLPVRELFPAAPTAS